jgi:DNA polymerase-3 subunit gamma/tau
MNANDLIEELSALNITMWPDGEKLRWKAPEGIVTDEVLVKLKEHKSEILAILKINKIDEGKMVEVPSLAPKVVRRGKGDFPHIYRPRRISEVYGQDKIKKVIAHGLDTGTLAHVLLFQGVSGTGKTTMGRIVAMGLNCEKGPTSEPCCECTSCRLTMNVNSFAVQEFDTAHLSGVEDIRRESGNFCAAPMGGEYYRIVIFDECHRLTPASQAVLLKRTEDVLDHLYFIFCTTGEIIETLRNRCMQFKFNALSDEGMRALLVDVCASEKFDADPALLESIIKKAKGMPRNALLSLQEAVALRAGRPVVTQVSKDT